MGQWSSGSDWDGNRFEIHKNGSSVAGTQGRNEYYNTMYVTTVLDMNGSSDYVEAFARQDSGGAVNAALDDSSRTRFGAYKLIT